MTSIFAADGKQTACTIIEAAPNTVTQIKTVESDGYTAVQLGFGDKKEKHSIKAEVNHFAKANTAPKKFVQEIRDSEIDKAVGETITVDIFAEGDLEGIITICFNGLLLSYNTWPCLDDRYRGLFAGSVKDTGHANLLSNNTFHVFMFISSAVKIYNRWMFNI